MMAINPLTQHLTHRTRPLSAQYCYSPDATGQGGWSRDMVTAPRNSQFRTPRWQEAAYKGSLCTTLRRADATNPFDSALFHSISLLLLHCPSASARSWLLQAWEPERIGLKSTFTHCVGLAKLLNLSEPVSSPATIKIK